ncbi:M56 family metallopeptidase [Streptomyces mirabilis]|uniref:M56 family metallopeptidase n=1 Tax=Streptomyces mirabilis TaxID=68239 RepID=UPI0036AF96BD
MTAAAALLVYASAIGFLAPPLMLRSDWPQHSPALAVAAWHALAVSFTAALALAAYHLATPAEHLHAGLTGLLHSCGLTAGPGSSPDPDAADSLAIALPVAVALLPLGSFVFEVLRARLDRSRHRHVLDIVGRRSAALRATVVDHERPAAYCLPGHRSRVVVSAGALRRLSADQLAAVLEHERAHIAGRHHLAMALSEAFARAFRWLPLARHAREQTSVLLEMIADDRALRSHPRDVLATALYEMAASAAPRGAFSAGGPAALLRLQRVLVPGRRPHPALSATMAATTVIVPLLPLLIGCAPAIG